MNIRKFTAPTARQALKDIRNELGDEAVILSNRKVGEGVEILALAGETMEQLTGGVTAEGSKRVQPFADPAQKTAKPSGKPVAQARHLSQSRHAQPVEIEPAQFMSGHDNILVEIKSMHSMLRQQLAALSWNDELQREPQRAGLLREMLNSGFSALLARQLLEKMPAGNTQGKQWIKHVLKHNLHVAGEEDGVVTKGGVYALIGPTGVGKTTTTAKLAARAVVRYGADKVALLTTDSYRIGAYEQLKIYGKILGVAVHGVKDTNDLRLTLSALKHKHLVLIDTVGMGQRDERVGGQNEMFDAAGVDRLLLLNATSGGDTLEDVVRKYHNDKVIGCIATKLDEAVHIGAVLDVVVRHRLVMHYMANGQRVPEDLHPINLDYLLHRAFKSTEEKTPFTLNEMEFPVLMAGTSSMAVSNAL
ncbi:MAG TPA: flagellar biosynthesis protein FlhF [Gallionella sp.]|nr:flagellar biosynthesis protein FlhF [Gallionella sp.]